MRKTWTELSNGKKKETLDLLNNYNKICSKREFKEIKNQLHDACKEGYLDLIAICLSETVENDSKILQFKIDETHRMASLFTIQKNIKKVIIQRTFEYKSVEYLITSIIGTSKNVETLKFVEDSAVKTIYGNVFPDFPSIKEIHFLASLKELKESWLNRIQNLRKITISTSNNQFKMKDNKYLIGKSDPKNDEFDTLLFVCRDIEEISIPSNIKIISSYAFSGCLQMNKIEIPKNSNLKTIEKYAFSESNLKEIFIPSTVSIIYEHALSSCFDLTRVEIPTNSVLKAIKSRAFFESNLREIFIPSTVSIICKCAFYCCKNLTRVEIPINSNL